MDDSEAVDKLKNGDADAFPVIVERYQKSVLNCCYKFLRNRESAEDVTQEVFLEVFESIRSFRGESKLSTWIYRIAVTRSLNQLQSQKRKKRFAVFVSPLDDRGLEDRVPSPGSAAPDSRLENEERADVLARALDRLPRNQKIAFTLSKYDGLSYEEISRIMDASIPSVESLLHRAKVNLRKILASYYGETT